MKTHAYRHARHHGISAFSPAWAQAQGPWTLEVRAGGSAPTESFTTTDLKTGIGFEGTIGERGRVAGNTGGAPRQYRARVLLGDTILTNTTQASLLELVAAATLAPSSHNTQPWRFRVLERLIELVADRTRALPVNDPDEI